MSKNLTLRLLTKLCSFYCLWQFAMRIFLLLYSADDASWKPLDLMRTVLLGSAYDVVVWLYLATPLCCWLLIGGNKVTDTKWGQKVYQFLILAFFMGITFTTICEYYFWEEFHSRFNFIAVDYLVYTHELVKNIQESYPVGPLVGVVVVVSVFFTYAFLKFVPWQGIKTTFKQRCQTILPLFLVAALGLVGMKSSYTEVVSTNRFDKEIAVSLPPTPGQSILRRPDCQNLYNNGTPLQKAGYKTQFVYGYFDNMNGFYSGNGFAIFDRTNISKEKVFFETVWGVADEIIFDQALEQMDQETAQQPTLQLVMTTTNHRPYAFPEGKLQEPQGKRESVVKYTDWAIHRFLEMASQKPWFDNTVFIILADHNADVAGKVGLPISKYHIPCIVYAPKLVGVGHNKRLMSQIDVLPTVLGMLGMTYDTKCLGYDVNKLPKGKERAFISTYQQLGYVTGDKMIILEPNNKVTAYKINDFATNDYTKIKPDKELVADAVTWYQGASYLYKNKLLKVNS